MKYTLVIPATPARAFEVTEEVLGDLDDTLGYQKAVHGSIRGRRLPVACRALELNQSGDGNDSAHLGEFVVLFNSGYPAAMNAEHPVVMNAELFSSVFVEAKETK